MCEHRVDITIPPCTFKISPKIAYSSLKLTHFEVNLRRNLDRDILYDRKIQRRQMEPQN
jgi:hypothetical protein